MEFGYWLVIVVVGIFFIGILRAFARVGNKGDVMRDLIENQKDFSITHSYMGDGKSGIAIDEERGKLCLSDFSEGFPSVIVIEKAELLSCQLVVDGAVTMKKVKPALVADHSSDGLSVDQIPDDLSQGNQGTQKVFRITLKLTTDNPAYPELEFKFLDKLELEKSGPFYETIMGGARSWYHRVEALIGVDNVQMAESR